ncbi:MAG: geranylgeranyl reductase family protein [Actinomycetota bacterium]
MADLQADMLIVGGGPAGAAAAIEARRAARDVIVIDKASFPRDKCCGDGLTTGALRHLDQLGFDPRSVPSWRTVSEVVVTPPSGRSRRFPLPGPADGQGTFAAVARRREFDVALLDLARKAGADVLERHALTTITEDRDRVTVQVDGPTGRLSVEAPAVIAADGMWSTTRKLLGVKVEGYRGDWHAFRQYFEQVSGPANRELLVWFEPDLLPGYAWSFPVDDRSANVGFGILRTPGQTVQPMKDLWPRLLARPHIAAALGPHAVPEEGHRAWPIPTRLGELPFSVGRVLFVGDALAAGDPMTGEGIGQAIETGRQAVQSLVDGPGRTDPVAAAERYERLLRQGMFRDHRMARVLSSVLGSARGANASVAIAGATGWTRSNFARWLFEDYPRAALLTPGRWRRGMFSAPGAFTGDEDRSLS